MSLGEMLTILTSITAGVTAGLGAIALILKKVIARHLDAIERVPPKEWFDKIEVFIDAFPDAERLERHIAMGHEHANILQVHEFRIDTNTKRLDDHGLRIRALEIT